MKRRSLFLAAAAGLLVLAVGAPKSQAGTLDALLGTTVSNNGLNFTFDSWGDATLLATQVTVVFNNPGTEAGFTLSAAFGAAVNASADGNLVFNVSGANINDASLSGNPKLSAGSNGSVTVTESIYSGGGPPVSLPAIATLFIQPTPPPGADSALATFSPQTEITVIKDIEAHGGTTGTGVDLSSVAQNFSTTSIPEPTSLALLGIGLSGLFTLRRFFKRTSVA